MKHIYFGIYIFVTLLILVNIMTPWTAIGAVKHNNCEFCNKSNTFGKDVGLFVVKRNISGSCKFGHGHF